MAKIVSTISSRFALGSGLKFWIIDIPAATTQNIPIPPANQEVTVRNIALLHTSYLSETATKRISDGRLYYKFEIVVFAPSDVVDRIKQVTYILPEAWPEKFRVNLNLDRASRFKFKQLANGSAIVLAKIEFIDTDHTIMLNRFIDLRPDGPRL